MPRSPGEASEETARRARAATLAQVGGVSGYQSQTPVPEHSKIKEQKKEGKNG